MAIIKWEPFPDFDRFFEDFGSVGFPQMPKMGWDLAIDVYEDGNDVVAKMNLPGIDPKNVDVTVEDAHLRIAGSRSEEKEEKKKQYYSKEIRRGSFERVVRLPHPVMEGKIKAEYQKGVLTVRMPKASQTKGNKIKIEEKE
ncbi:Hsp20/alpha crystallin family protein [bacterium]|nr:Hsp20/alpha crystallin family protein [bacterium]MCI0566174.1 Hsp20/alpha crystallin family protein [bacterium]MCI0680133.1 Hsp20/alpha crystallin family protein [bacterium]